MSETDPAETSAANASTDGARQPDPAEEAIRHHLDALEHERFVADPTVRERGRTDQLRRRLAGHAPAVIDQRAVDADRHLAEALRALSDRVARVADWQGQDHRLAADLKIALDATAERLDELAVTQHDLDRRLDALTKQMQAAEETQRDDKAALRVEINRVRAGSEALAHVLRGEPVAPRETSMTCAWAPPGSGSIPTHIRPLHPELVAFMCTQRGVAEVEVRPLHPARHFDVDWGEALGLDVEPGSVAADILEDLRDAMAGAPGLRRPRAGDDDRRRHHVPRCRLPEPSNPEQPSENGSEDAQVTGSRTTTGSVRSVLD